MQSTVNAYLVANFDKHIRIFDALNIIYHPNASLFS